eukprot:6769096-Alexandrium_andersonii.AAC.1
MSRRALSAARNRRRWEPPPASVPGTGGAALRKAPPAPGSASGGMSDFGRVRDKAYRGPFGPLGEAAPLPPRAGFGADEEALANESGK